MDIQKKLKRANQLNSEIYQNQDTIKKVDLILADYDNHRLSIDVKQSQGNYGFSFGSKKYNFKQELFAVLNRIKEQEEASLYKNNEDLKILLQ